MENDDCEAEGADRASRAICVLHAEVDGQGLLERISSGGQRLLS